MTVDDVRGRLLFSSTATAAARLAAPRSAPIAILLEKWSEKLREPQPAVAKAKAARHTDNQSVSHQVMSEIGKR